MEIKYAESVIEEGGKKKKRKLVVKSFVLKKKKKEFTGAQVISVKRNLILSENELNT